VNSIGTCATLACIWEATAPKPGNVYRGADFEDVTYADFLASAAVIGPAMERARTGGVGKAVLEAVEATQQTVSTNTNLGTLLLLAPLAASPREKSLAEGISEVLASLTQEDTRSVYEAIRLANPGGLGSAETADVRDEIPTITLVEAMQLAAERDLVARQYTNRFEQVFWVAEQILAGGQPLGHAIVQAYLRLIAEFPDSLIARKVGLELSQQVSLRAQAVLSAEPDDFPALLADFDFWLRADGHRRNPGTSADLIAAGLFVLLREKGIHLPVRFY